MIADGGLGGCVGGRTRYADQPGTGGNVDDGPGLFGAHGPDGVLGSQEYAIEVGLMHRAPGTQADIFRVVHQIAAFEAGDASVVDDNIQRTVISDDGIGRCIPVGFFADVEVEVLCLRAEFCCDSCAEFVVDVGQVDKGTFIDESAGDGFADAAGCAGDKGDF